MILGSPRIAGQGPAVLRDNHRCLHLLLLGATNTGKSTTLLHLINNDKDHAIILLDPAGDLALKTASLFPPERLIYVDKDNPISLNPLTVKGLNKTEKANLITEVINSSVKAISPDQVAMTVKMSRILKQAVNVIDDRLLSLKFLGDFLDFKSTRDKYFLNKPKPQFWQDYDHSDFQHQQTRMSGQRISDRFSLLYDDENLKPFLEGENELDIEMIVREKKALIVNLGNLDDEFTSFIGNLVSHQLKSYYYHQSSGNSGKLFFYVDEWHLFINDLFQRFLVEARKYNISINMSGHSLIQVSRELAQIALSNTYTKLIFNCSYKDTEIIFKEVGLEPDYVYQLKNYETIAIIGKKFFHLKTYKPLEVEPFTPPPPPKPFSYLRPGWI
jgi:hypothetical protein